jgi:Protein of unknown function (DUF2917)
VRTDAEARAPREGEHGAIGRRDFAYQPAMDEYIVQGSVGMTRGSMLRIDDGRDILVYVWEGEVWVTQDGDRRDHMLRAGDWFRLDRNGSALVYSFRRSVLTLTAPEPEYYAQRVLLLRAGSSTPLVLYDAREARGAVFERFAARLRRAWARLYFPQARPTTAAL